jgi:uncharacterized protein (UPF0262 family)
MTILAKSTSRLVSIELDRSTVKRWAPEVEHEREVAIFDLLESNSFRLIDRFDGPYRLELGLRESNIILDITNEDGSETHQLSLSARPLRRIIKDYFMICENYFKAIKGATPSKIEALDMARRGLHNEGADVLGDALSHQIALDNDTRRRLFTLICVLHVR